jgi:hypothetical protein
VTNIREELNRQLPESPVTDLEWDHLVDQGYVADVEVEASEVDDLVGTLRQLRRTFGGTRQTFGPTERIEAPPPKDQSITERIDALSTIFAAWAAEDSDVKRFRNRHLLDWDDLAVRSWLKNHRRGTPPEVRLLKEDQVLTWITQAHHARSATGDGDEHVTELVRIGGRTDTLDYVVDQQVRRVTVDANGPLGELAKVADRLTHRFRWHPAEATVFVLTGKRPEVLILTASAETRTDVATRLILTIDPVLPPQQVAEFYADVRAQIAPVHVPRHLSAKHYRLAQHVGPRVSVKVLPRAQLTGPGRRPGSTSTDWVTKVMPVPPSTWATFYAEWQRTVSPKWRYSQQSNFQRDAKKALLRLLWPQWQSSARSNDEALDKSQLDASLT